MQCILARGTEKNIVVDQFMGSATAVLAAKMLTFYFSKLCYDYEYFVALEFD